MSNLAIENLGNPIQLGNSPLKDRLSGMAGELAGGREASQSSVGSSATTFSDMLRASVDNVNQQQVEADTAIKDLIVGRNKNIHETMLTIERADASLKMMMQVRNKILDAYREVMRMQI